MNNRIIKFRAWSKKNKAMLETPLKVRDLMRYSSEDELELMQFTGLKDKNGNEIYEGDIVENGDWDENAHAHQYRRETIKYIDDEGCYRGWNFNVDGMTCEVIGNIYENPELLK